MPIGCNGSTIDRNEKATVRALTPDEANGAEADENFAMKKEKELVIEASFREARGQAFTDAPGNREGRLGELLTLDLRETVPAGKYARETLKSPGL
jgi:hypothetical protein